MPKRCNVDDARALSAQYLGQQEFGEEERREVVDAKLMLEAVLRLGVGSGRDARHVDEDIDVFVVGQHALGAFSRLLQSVKLQDQASEPGIGRPFPQSVDGSVCFGLRSTRDDEQSRILLRKASGRLEADGVGAASSHQHDLVADFVLVQRRHFLIISIWFASNPRGTTDFAPAVLVQPFHDLCTAMVVTDWIAPASRQQEFETPAAADRIAARITRLVPRRV
jgi:hypothetical protein